MDGLNRQGTCINMWSAEGFQGHTIHQGVKHAEERGPSIAKTFSGGSPEGGVTVIELVSLSAVSMIGSEIVEVGGCALTSRSQGPQGS